MTREERKALTLELAEHVRKQLEEIKVAASVRCHFYRNSACMVLVYPKSPQYKALNHWEAEAYNKGLEYWLKSWMQVKHGDRFKQAANIYCD